MEVRILEEKDRDLWNNFVSKTSPQILQSYEWGEFKGAFGWSPIRLGVFDDGKIVAGASILKRKMPILGRSLFYIPRGPLLDFKNKKLLDALFLAIELQAQKHKAIALKMDPEIAEDDSEALSIIKEIGFKKGKKQIQPRSSFHINLEANQNDLIMSFEEKTRYNIRLAQKKGVKVVNAGTREGIEIFYKIYQETAKREKFLIHPFSYYQRLKDILIDKGYGQVFLAYYNDMPIAGIFVFCFGSRIWYMYGASSGEYRNVMPNHALHWHTILWAKERGYKTYDLWGIPINPEEKHPLWGVYRFKKGFNGKLVKLIGVYDLPFEPLYYNLFEAGINLWQNFRSLITKGKIEDSLSE